MTGMLFDKLMYVFVETQQWDDVNLLLRVCEVGKVAAEMKTV